MQRSLLVLIALGLLAGQAMAQEREWSLDASDQEAYLIFGVADTDDVGVSLWCPLRKGGVHLFLPLPTEELSKYHRRKVAMTVTAAAETATFAAKVDIAEGDVNSSVEAEVPVTHPLFQAMEKADRFSVRVEGRDVVFPLYDANLPDFLDQCRKP